MKHNVSYQKKVRYELMLGQEASEAIAHYPVGYLPVGCLEKHGDHLPMGLDVIKAHKICCVVAQSIGGIVFPPHYYSGIHRMSGEQIKHYTGQWGNIYTDSTAEESITDIIKQIGIAGIKLLVLYTGHYPTCQIEMVKEIAKKFDHDSNIQVIPFVEPFATKEGDHAGINETSLMLYLDKNLVDMTRISKVNYQDHGWTEDNSPEKATLARGKAQVNKIVAYLQQEIERLEDDY